MTTQQLTFRKAEKKQSKLRLALIAPSGFGKTYSALRVATGLGGKIAVLDTENGSADLYADKFEYDVLTMSAPYKPEKYVMAIKAAEEAGYTTLIIDSLSHAWVGEGGSLDKHGTLADKGGNSWAAWRKVTPDHNRLVEAILQSKLHIIASMRAKTEWIVGDDKKPVKVGLSPVQRDGVEYEFTVVLDLDDKHNGHCSKDRTGLFDGQITFMDEKIGERLSQWLEGK